MRTLFSLRTYGGADGSTVRTGVLGFPYRCVGAGLLRSQSDMDSDRVRKISQPDGAVRLISHLVDHFIYRTVCGISLCEKTDIFKKSVTARLICLFVLGYIYKPCPPCHGTAFEYLYFARQDITFSETCCKMSVFVLV